MIALIILGIVAWTIYLYNKLVLRKNRKDEAWSGIDVQLKRRHDLIPSLVAVVKGYSSHEQQTLEEVTALRTKSQQQTNVREIGSTENAISKDLRQIFALVEQYPDLKANESFLELQANLTKIEDDLQFARRYYNGTVRDYKVALESFPSNLIAKVVAFPDADFFELEFATERSAPEVGFSS